MSKMREVDPSISKNPIALEASDLPTVCVLCSHNCGVRVDVEEGRISRVRADENNPITQGYICNKGVTIDRYAHHQQRVEHPLRRRDDGSFERIDWDTAITEIAAKLGEIRSKYSPRAIGLVGIGGQGNHMDAAYASSFLRGLGSRRWFNAFAQEKTQHMLVAQWMFDASPTCFLHPDLHATRYLLVMGTNPRISNRGHNPTETLKALAKSDDCKLVAVDPRETETTRGADQHVRVRPGGDVYMLLGMAAVMVQHELYDAEFIAGTTLGFNELRDVLARIDVGDMAARAGLDKATIEEIASEFAASGASALMWDLGLEMTPFSTLLSYLIQLNLTLSGDIGRVGGEIFLETFLPPTLSPGRHGEPERALASGIAAIRALGNFGMFSPVLIPEEIMLDHPEHMRALVVEGSNPLLSFSDTKAWREAIDHLELMVVIEPAMTETAMLADYVLPTPCGYEKWEIAMFPKRHPQIDVQLRPPVIPGPPEALPEPEIYARLAAAMEIVDPLPEDLRELGRPETADARGAFLLTAMSKLPELAERGINGESQLLFWAYQGIGHHFDAPSLVAIYANSQANAMERKDDVVRALGGEWADKDSFAIGEEIFRRILAHPEGVEIARVELEGNLERHLGYQDKRIRVAPAPMLSEIDRALEASREPDPDYPFVLCAGSRTRWTANTIQRDPAWRKGSGPHCPLSVSPDDAEELGLGRGDSVRVETNRGSLVLPVLIDRRMMAGHVSVPNGFGVEYATSIDGKREIEGANCNEITDAADRDPITGCPHHRYVPVKLTRVAAASQAA